MKLPNGKHAWKAGTILSLTLVLASLLASITAAQTGLPGRRAGSNDPNPLALIGPMDLLARRDVQSELELLDEQLIALSEFREQESAKQRERWRDLLAGARDGSIDRTKLRDHMQQELANANQRARDKIAQVLLPHQQKRLAQIELQRKMRMGGLAGVTARELADQLEITEQQRQKMREMSERAEAELRRRMAELRAEMQKEVLSVLTPAQKLKLQDMVGRPFEFADPDRSSRTGPQPTPAAPPE